MPVAIALAECDEWFGADAWRGVFVVQMLAAALTFACRSSLRLSVSGALS